MNVLRMLVLVPCGWLVAAAVAQVPAGPRLLPQDFIPPAELEAFVDGTVRLAMDQRHIAGVAVAVVQDGRVVLQKGYGFASFAPERAVDPATTLFRIGSITKTFTWIAVMRAVEAGKLDLEAPINDYLPPELKIPDHGYEHPIRLYDLMTHSPGFDDRVLGVLFTDDPERLVALAEFLQRYRPQRVRETGVLSSYSNYGTALAGMIVSRIEGVEWQTLVERDILAPLALTHVTTREPYPPRTDLPAPLPAALAADLSEPFRWNGLAYAPRKTELLTPIAPAGVMSASARDMARYMRMLLGDGTLDGVTIFGPQAARAFRTPMTQLPIEVGALDAGFFESVLPGGFHGYGHNGGTLSFFTNMTVVPELRLGVFVATNTEGGGALSDPLPARIVERFYAPPRSAPKPGASDAAAFARAYAGEYLSTRRRYGGLEGFVMGLQRFNVSVSPDGYLLAGGGSMRRYVPAGTDLFEAVDREGGGPPFLHFEREQGRVVRVAVVPIAFERVELLRQRSTLIPTAGLAAFAVIAVMIGAFVRLGRALPATPVQRVAGRVLLTAAAFWLVSLVAFSVGVASAGDVTAIIYGWPLPAVLLASAAALAATAFTAAGLLLLPAVWRATVGQESWPLGRQLRYSVTLAIFAALGWLLAVQGALVPWHY